MSGCLDKRFEEMLWSYEVGMLEDDDRRALELHALECDSCRRNLLQFANAARLITDDPDVRRTIHEIGADRPAAARPSGASRHFFGIKFRPAVVPALLAAAAVVALVVLQPWHIEFHSTQEAVAVENRLAVMYFDNLADPGDAQRLGEIAANLLITDLSSSSYIQVVSGQRLYDILKLLGREGQKHIDREIAREVADTARADLMLLGGILQIEPVYIVTAQLTEVSTGDVITSERVVGEPGEDIFAIVDRLTVQIKNNLSLPAGAAQEPDRQVAEITTSSPEAYRNFLEGKEYLNKYYAAEAVEKFTRAVELDSTFAMAYYYLAGLTDRSLIEKAVAYLDRAGPREQYFIRSQYAAYQDDTPQAIAELKAAAKRFPDEKSAHYLLGVYSMAIAENDQAIECFNRALGIDPAFKQVFNYLAYLYDRMGEYEKAISAIDTYISLAPGEANPYDTRGEICAGNGRIDQAIASFAKAIEIKPDFQNSLLNLGNLYLLRQDYARAESLYVRLATQAGPTGRPLGRLYLSFIPLAQGKFSEALRRLDEGLAADSADGRLDVNVAFKHFIKSRIYEDLGQCEKAIAEFDVHMAMFHEARPTAVECDRNIYVQLLVECGRIAEANRITQQLKEDIDSANGRAGAYLYAMGCIKLDEGRAEEAISLFREAMNTWYDYPVHVMLARAYLAAGRVAEGVAEFETLQTTYDKFQVFWTIWNVQSYYHLGIAYEKSNWFDKAIAQYETFLSLWKDADHESEMLRDAAARLAALQEAL